MKNTKNEHLKGFKYDYWYMICIEYISTGRKYYFSTIENAAKFIGLTTTQLIHAVLLRYDKFSTTPVCGTGEPILNDFIKIYAVAWDMVKNEKINPKFEESEIYKDLIDFNKLVKKMIEQNKQK